MKQILALISSSTFARTGGRAGEYTSGFTLDDMDGDVIGLERRDESDDMHAHTHIHTHTHSHTHTCTHIPLLSLSVVGFGSFSVRIGVPEVPSIRMSPEPSSSFSLSLSA